MDYEVARAIAREAVRETLLTLGIDIASPGAIQAAQADFAFIRRQRRAGEALKANALRMLVTLIGMGLFGLLTWCMTALRWNGQPPAGTY